MKVLVIRFSSAGDVLLTSLFVRALRTRFPLGRITYLTKRSFAPFVTYSPHVDDVIAIPDDASRNDLTELRERLLGEGYDVVFDLHNNLRSRFVRRGVGRELAVFVKPTLKKQLLVRFKINLFREIVPIPERYLAIGRRYGIVNDGQGLELFLGSTRDPIPDDVPGPLFALAPGARHTTKQWPVERFAQLGEMILERFGGTIVLLGGGSEIDTCNGVAALIGETRVLNLAGKTTLLEAAAAIDRCTAVIANDSALAHVAAARKRPVVAIFGSTVREFGFAPYASNAVVVEHRDLPCRPCTTIGRDKCPLGHFKCMREIEAESVLQAVIGMGGEERLVDSR